MSVPTIGKKSTSISSKVLSEGLSRSDLEMSKIAMTHRVIIVAIPKYRIKVHIVLNVLNNITITANIGYKQCGILG